FNFLDIEKTPDTRPIHKLLIAAGTKAEPLSEAFYQAYFLDGLDISDTDVQAELASKAGLDFTELAAQDEEAESQLAEDLDEGRMAGIEGVPLMIFAGRYSVAGAYPPDVLVSAIDAYALLAACAKALCIARSQFLASPLRSEIRANSPLITRR
ncbi:MAG: hypothetical protein EBR12_05955, partial [Proteobacteria bacterium]|nr:hypothetical protein [Pseudomonadota bacterium]